MQLLRNNYLSLRFRGKDTGRTIGSYDSEVIADKIRVAMGKQELEEKSFKIRILADQTESFIENYDEVFKRLQDLELQAEYFAEVERAMNGSFKQ